MSESTTTVAIKPLDIELELDTRFVNQYHHLVEKYGPEMEAVNGFANKNLNFSSFIDHFVDSKVVADSGIDGNANSHAKDVRTLLSNMTKPHTKLLAFNKIYYDMCKRWTEEAANEWFENEWSGAFYLHNASTASFYNYCYAFDLDQIVEKGLFFIERYNTDPPKHLTTFNDHVLEFVCWASNRSSGAVGLPSYLIYSWYFWNKDVQEGFYLKNPEYYRRQCFQKYVFDSNQPFQRIVECSFTNITVMDRPYLEELFGSRVFPDGTMVIDHIEEIIEHEKVFMEVVAEIRKKKMMTFPVITFSLLYQNGKFVDEEFARWANKHNMQWYDANFYVGNDVTSLSSCCRLVSDTSKLTPFINSIGGTSLSVGSVQVNTINLRRIALEANKDEEKYLEILTSRVHNCIKSLEVIRHIIQRNIEKGLLPTYTYKLIELDKQYSTIGLTAMYEVLNDFGYIETDEFGNKSYTEDGMRFSQKIMDTINTLKDSYRLEFKFNVEMIPAERANVILAKKDTILYQKHYENFISYPLYANQWIPLMEKCTIKEKVHLGAILDKTCGGGQISHIQLESGFSTEEQSWKMLNYIASQGVIYFAYNTKISVCRHEHAFYGETCPICGEKKSDTYTRVVGFLTPVSDWIKERREYEFPRRTFFNPEDFFDIEEGLFK